eukprot:CAMPEP_0206247096 /NCGR_PEP_ID=MMETSP0047_2-20121206/19624_1 /ASSEMBLY_ACC=CAM_ASM_000192 /TAXON_ID=195065 /ORGANISM="Chroomonas mesostigmatica_cf, Strain CCMP1168" /LENGTH=138 /DNA_ID=CAMNT_0053672591 /DNA_START=63 /DNA_END=475 /DNA_ORIENTATION=-
MRRQSIGEKVVLALKSEPEPRKRHPHPLVPELRLPPEGREGVRTLSRRGADEEKWYRRHGFESQRIKHFRTPLDINNFVQKPRPLSAQSPSWLAKDWLWDADCASRLPMQRWKASLCTISPAAQVFNRALQKADLAFR